MPADEVTPDLESELQTATRRYCDAKLRELEDRQTVLRHEGWSALLVSVPLLLVALLLTLLAARSALPSLWEDVLGNGVLLIVAWVVLWYPLDTLLWYGRPLARQIAVVGAMGQMEVDVHGEHARRRDRVAADPVGAASDPGARRGIIPPWRMGASRPRTATSGGTPPR